MGQKLDEVLGYTTVLAVVLVVLFAGTKRSAFFYSAVSKLELEIWAG